MKYNFENTENKDNLRRIFATKVEILKQTDNYFARSKQVD